RKCPVGLDRRNAHLSRYILRYLPERSTLRAFRRRNHDRHTQVACFADAQRERNGAQKRYPVTLGESLATAVPENLMPLLAVRADEIAHILNNAKAWNMKLIEHVVGLPDVAQGDLLRSRDEHRACQRDELSQTQLNIPGARGHIHDQVVDLTPLNLAEEL